MFLNYRVCEDSDKCPRCLTWGRTVDLGECPCAVPCTCGRLTWPNEGVNIVAGSAWAVACGNGMRLLQEREIWELLHG
jgi:hypothetical protein